MTSTYSSNLRLELIGTGDQSSTWGTTTNTNLGTLLEQAISGVSDVVFSSDADKTLSTVNGGTDEARQMIISLTSSLSLTATRNVIVPSVDKLYVVKNGTSGGRSIVVKTSAGTGITITNGETTMVWCDGTNVYSALDYTPALTIGAGGLSLQGNFNVGGTAPNDAVGINVDTTLVTSGTNQYGVFVQPTYDDTATVGIYGYRSLLTGGAAASSYTTNNVYNYRSGNFTLGTNQIVTDFYGFYGDDLTTATNNYGVSLNTAAATASTITSIVGSAGTVTVTTSGVHGLATGDKVLIANVTGAMTSGSYNGGPYTVTVVSTTVFTYSSAATSSALTTGNAVKANNWNVYAAGTGNNLFSGPVITSTSSTLPALRITQTGTGDAFVVEDSTNPDTTPFVINASGSVGIGTSSPSTSLNVYNATSATISVDGDSATTLRSTRYSTDSTPTELILRKARGTLASPSTVATSDTTGGLYFQAYGGTNFRNVGRIDGLVETYTSDSNIAGALRFYTNNSSTDVGERMRISSTGNVGIGATGLTTSSLRVSKSITGDTTAQSIRSDGAIQTDVTSQAFYFISSANMASGTLGSLFHYAASQGTIGATVTNQSGFASISSLIGATNNFAFNAQDTAAVTAGKTAYGYFSAVNTATGGGTTYGFYANGTANNYFGGNVGIGSTSLTGYSLRVAKNITGAAIGYGVFADGAIQSDVTTAAYFATSGNAGSTLSNLFHYTAGQGTLGATVGVQHGFRAESSLIGATNNFGFVASNTAAVTAGKTAYGYYSAVNTATGGGTTYGFYAAGTADNYFNGNVGIGTTTPDGNLEVSGIATTQYITRYSTDTSSPDLYFRKSRGTESARTVLVSGDNIGQINFQGYDGSSFSNAAQILVDSDGTPGVGDMPGRMLFRLSPDGSSSVATRIAILSTGYVGIGNTAPVCILDVTGGIQTSRTTVTSPAATDGNIFSGTYTPTLTNTTNVASSTASAAQYMRVGNVVTVSGVVIIDPTTAATNSVLNMSLPIASAITASRQLAGTGCSISTTKYGDNVLAIFGDATNDRAEFRFNPTGAASETYIFSFTYQVL